MMRKQFSAKAFLREAGIALRELRILWAFSFARPKEFWYVVRPARAPFWFSLAISLFMLLNDQASDILTTIASVSPLQSPANFLSATGLLAFSATAWYWARAVLYVWYEFTPGYRQPSAVVKDPTKKPGRLRAIAYNLALIDSGARSKSDDTIAQEWEPTRKWTARWIGLLPIVAITVKFGYLGYWAYFAFYAAVAILFLAFMIWRRDIALKRWVFKKKGKERDEPITVALHPFLPSNTAKTLAAWLLGFIVVLVLSSGWSVGFPQLMEPMGTLLLTASPLVAVFAFLAYLKDMNMRWLSPTFIVVLFAIIVGLWNDNHAIRMIETTDTRDTSEESRNASVGAQRLERRPDVAGHFSDWLKHRFGKKASAQSVPSPSYPVFVVAAEGGGIRAAYWTAAVLARLQLASNGAFGCHLFAISGVSGGSLGGAAFVAELANASGPEETRCGPGEPPASQSAWHGAALEFLGRDFLSPTLAGMMTSDLLSRVNPFCIPALGLTSPCLPDRAAYLEHAWESEWDDLMENKDARTVYRFSSPFTTLWTASNREGRARRDLPSLLLNGTWVGIGSRNVTSNLRTDIGSGRLVDSEDIVELLSQPIRLSTAVLNSARFTYVSPPGTIRLGDRRRRIVDGGYFENSGALTAREIVATIRSVCRTEPLCERHNIRTVALILTNNPKRSLKTWREGGERVCAADESRDNDRGQGQDDNASAIDFLTEISSPIVALFNTREARGSLAEKELIAANGAGKTFRFALRPAERGELPLGWALSTQAQREIRAQAVVAVDKCDADLWAEKAS